jgi:hypothetical protein
MVTSPHQPDDDPWADDTWDMGLPSEQAALEALRLTWGECYDIGCDDGQWWYKRKDGTGGTETARTPDDLRTQIAQDYSIMPARRRPSPTARAVQWT